MAIKVVFITTVGGSTYTIPNDYGSLVSIEAIGGGGGSYRQTAAGGAGGGAYAAITSLSSLIAGGSVFVNIGDGGTAGTTPTSGGNTWFNAVSNAAPTLTTQGVLARGGGVASGTAGAAGAGGAAGTSIGTTVFSGGNGGTSVNGSVSKAGGGGAAGPGGNGGTGGNGFATGSAAASAAGGGGSGATLTLAGTAGSNGTSGVGGAGGASTGQTGGNGATASVLANATTAPANGGGGGGGATGATGNGSGGDGAAGTYWTATAGGTAGSGGGGGGATAVVAAPGGVGALYGGGAGGSGSGSTTAASGGQGIIVITYDDVVPIRYWVGGTGTWDTSTTTNWSLTSGGAGGASVPVANTNVIIDANSGTGTITMTGAVCRDLTVTASQAIILGAASSTLSISGNMTLPSGGSFSANTNSNTITFVSPVTGRTITTNGKALSNITFNGVGGGWTLGSALTASTITLTNGTFDTSSASNYTIAAVEIILGAGTKTLNLNASALTLSGEGPFNFETNSANFTFNAGTSTITSTATTTNIQPRSGGFTFYNVTFTQSPNGTIIFHNVGTYNNLTFATSTGFYRISLAGNQTINGTLTLGTANTAVQRIFIFSNTIGTARTITVNGTLATLSDVDFRDITAAGTVGTWTGTRLGNCLGNTNITFPAAKTVYWNLAGTQFWYSNGWATSSGGVPAVNNFPLAQDTAVFDNAGAAGSIGTNGSWNIGTIDMSARTTAFTFNFFSVAGTSHYGSLTLFSNLTLGSGLSGLVFVGRGVTQTFTSAGVTFPSSNTITIDNLTGTVQLADAFSSLASITLNSGTFNGNSYNVTCTTFTSNNSNTRTLTLGNGLWTLTGTGTVWNTSTTTGLTFNRGTSDILLSDTSTTARTFSGGALTYNKITIGGTTGISATTFGANSTYGELASTKTVAHTITFNGSPAVITTWSVTGTAGNVVTVNSSVAGTQRSVTITNKTTDIDYLNVQDINGVNINPYTFFVGSNSINSGNNIGVAFISSNNLSEKFAYLLTTGTTFTVPANWVNSNNQIYIIGGGGGGSGNSIATTTSTRIGGAGGGGGGYLGLTNRTYTPGSTIFYSIGAGGAGGAGAASSGTSTGGNGGSTLWDGTQSTITNLTPRKTQNTTAGTTITINVPTGTTGGDVMVAFLLSAGGTGTFTTPAGWRLGATATGRAIFYRVAGAGEPASYVFTASASNLLQGYIVTYENAVWGGISAASALASPTVAPSVTTTSTNSVVVAFYTSTNSLVTYSTPTDYTALDSDSDSTAGSSALFSRVYSAAGATGTATSTPSSGTSIGYQIFLSPNVTYSAIASGGAGGVATGGNTATGGVGGVGVTTLPSFVGSTIGTQGTSTTTINVPSGTANGDLMVMFVQSQDSGNNINAPAGWILSSGTNPSAQRVFYRTAASEPASYTVTTDGSDPFVGTISTFRNAAWDQRGAWSAASANPTAPAINVPRGGGFLLWIGGINVNNITSAFTAPVDYIPMQSTANNGVSFITSYTRNFFIGSSGTVQGVNANASTIGVLVSIIPNTTAGNTGGTGGGSPVSSSSGTCGGGGGGGAAGPNGNGRNGGNGSTGASVANSSGGGGGGNGGGTAGGNAVTNTSGAGGNNSLGSGGGASRTTGNGSAGTFGGGGSGAGGESAQGGAGGAGIDIQNTVGSGGGSGGANGGQSQSQLPGLYGGGAGGAGGSGFTSNGGNARPGMIFILFVVGGNAFTDSITENTSLADSLTLLARFNVNATENSRIDDVEVITGQFIFNITENSNTNDVRTITVGFSVSVTEDILMDDQDNIGIIFDFTLTENVTMQDFNSALIVFVKSISEGITLADLNTLVTDFVASITENGLIQDSATNVLNTSLSITENANLADAIIGSLGVSFSRTEPMTVEETEAINAQFAQSRTEPTTMNDVRGSQTAFNVPRTEPTTLDDIETIRADFKPSIAENINMNDLRNAVTSFLISIAEATTIDDFETVGSAFADSIAENIRLTEAQAASVQVLFSINENIVIDDIESFRVDYATAIFESVGLLDIICYNGWFRINDSQTPSWSTISTPSGTWTDINDAQTPGWDTIDTSQPCS